MENEKINVRPLTPEEQKYTYSASTQLEGQTGNIGHLRGDFGSDGKAFYTTWFDTRQQWKTDEFKSELDGVINSLRSPECGLLCSRAAMAKYTGQFPESAYKGNFYTEYGFRADTGKYAFLLRCNTAKGDYNFYCYCYIKEWLDKHISRAERGIRFIDSGYKELFRIPDGGKIILTTAWGEKSEHTCRYIDECHTEIGRNLFHICEFAERMEKNGATYEPKKDEPQQKQRAAKHREQER